MLTRHEQLVETVLPTGSLVVRLEQQQQQRQFNFFYLNASTLVNTDTVRSAGGEKTLRSSRLPPPKYMLSKTLNERAHQPCANQQKRKQRAEHCFNLTQSYLYIPNNEQPVENHCGWVHFQSKEQVLLVAYVAGCSLSVKELCQTAFWDTTDKIWDP